MQALQKKIKSNRMPFFVLVVLIFSICAYLLLTLLSATTTPNGVMLEAEAITTTNQLIREDPGASGSRYLLFGHGDHIGNSSPIPYIPPTDPNYNFDPSVIPEDDLIVTTFHGINRGRGQELFTVDCGHSHFSPVDPIVFPGRPPTDPNRSHFHEFFGYRNLNENSTLQSIISSANNNCEVGGDRSSYWTPTAYQNGVPVKSDNNKFYYKVGDLNDAEIARMQPFPLGLRMVAGNAMATKAQSKNVTFYYASPKSECPSNNLRTCKDTSPHLFETGPSTRNLPTIPNTANGFRALIRFPQCWDGKHLWLPGTEHVVYAVNGRCPADTHPIPLPQVQFNLGWMDAVGGSGFTLSSGEWYTLHGDFLNGWKPETLERLIDVCTRAQRYCGMTESNDPDSVDETKSTRPCMERPAVKTNKIGCIELRKGETEPRFFGKTYP